MKKTHGMADKHPLYHVWQLMKNRCHNPNAADYERYGARGIKVCEQWRNSFESFYSDMSSSWKAGLTIERNDVNGNYEKDNCSWITRGEQNNNKRNTVRVVINGEEKTLAQWARHYGIPLMTVYSRRLRGFPPDRWFDKKEVSLRPRGRYATGEGCPYIPSKLVPKTCIIS